MPCSGQDEDGVQPLSAKQARLLKKLARQPDALAGLLQASTKKSAAKAKVRRSEQVLGFGLQ